MAGSANHQPSILVAPLDWGLGHTTRCIPVIHELLEQQANVILAGNKNQLSLLGKEFPNLPQRPLAGYEIHYSAKGAFTSILGQIPRIWSKIKEEHTWLKQLVQKEKIDGIISDNRFGMHHPGIPSVFITHQLRIKNPLGALAEKLIQQKNYQYIEQFRQCWIPDLPGNDNLAGELSHPTKMPAIPFHYTGALTRIKPSGNTAIANHLFISLSGPEPQRSLLEDKIINELMHFNGTATIVRGLPAEEKQMPSTNHFRFYNHLPTEEFNEEMSRAEWIIARTGYSSVMDILAAGKKSILIPTPGQPEQEFLGDYLMNKQYTWSVSQKRFSLMEALREAGSFSYQTIDVVQAALLKKAVSSFLSLIK